MSRALPRFRLRPDRAGDDDLTGRGHEEVAAMHDPAPVVGVAEDVERFSIVGVEPVSEMRAGPEQLAVRGATGLLAQRWVEPLAGDALAHDLEAGRGEHRGHISRLDRIVET